MSGRDVTARLSVLEADLKHLQHQPGDNHRYRDMAKLLQVYETKLSDAMNEKQKLERYAETLETQISELVNMTAEVRDIRFILKNQKALKEALEEQTRQNEKLRSEYQQKSDEELKLRVQGICEEKQRELNEARARDHADQQLLRQRYQEIYEKQVEHMRAQFRTSAALLQQTFDEKMNQLGDRGEKLQSTYQQQHQESMQLLRQNLKSVLRPLITMILCKSHRVPK